MIENIEGHSQGPYWACYRGDCADEDCYEGQCCEECTRATSKYGDMGGATEVVAWPCPSVLERSEGKNDDR